MIHTEVCMLSGMCVRGGVGVGGGGTGHSI